MRKIKDLFLWSAFFFCSSMFCQQTKLEVFVTNSSKMPLESVTISFFDEQANNLFFGRTDGKGVLTFESDFKNIKKLIVYANSLGFYEKTLEFDINFLISNPKIDIRLIESSEMLKEVVIESDQKIKIAGDTTFIKVAKFVNNTEQTLEDVLKKLPGIKVSPDGSVIAHGKPIDKLLVDGDDVFDKNYKLLTKNLDAKVLEEIQILDSFEDNPILKQLSNSQKVALNIKFKKQYTNIWFGNVAVGAGTFLRYKTSANIGLLKKRIKLFNFGDSNNIGEKGFAQIGEGEQTIDVANPEEPKIEKKTSNFFTIDSQQKTELEKSLTLFNEAISQSASGIRRFGKNLIVRSVGYFITDSQIQNFASSSQYNFENNPIMINENSNFSERNRVASANIEAKYLYSNRSYFTNLLSFNNKTDNFGSTLTSNNINIAQKNVVQNTRFNNHLENTYAFKKNKILRSYLYFGTNKIKEQATINSQNLKNFFNDNSNNAIRQNTNNQLFNYGFRTAYTFKNSNFETTTLLHFDYENENLSYQIVNDQNIIFDNNAAFFVLKKTTATLHNKFSYFLSQDNFADATLEYSKQHLNSKRFDLFNIKFGIKYRIKKFGKLSAGYNFKNELPSNRFLFQSNYLSSYRNFAKGTNEIKSLKQSVFMFTFTNYNTKKRFDFDSSISYYSKKFDISTATTINQNLTFLNYIYTEGAQTITSEIGITNYFRRLKTAARLESNQNWYNIPLQINSDRISIAKSYVASYKASARTHFEKFCNFDVGANFNKFSTDFDGGATTGTTYDFFGNINLTVKDVLTLEFKSSTYFINQFNYKFLNFSAAYQQKQSPFYFNLTCNNILNEEQYTNQQLDGLSNFRTTVQLVPRYVFFLTRYRF